MIIRKTLAIIAGLIIQGAAYASPNTVTNYTSGGSDAVQRDGYNDVISASSGTVTGEIVRVILTNYQRKPIFQFPIAALPATNEIQSATINLYVNTCTVNSTLRFRAASGTGTASYDAAIESNSGSIVGTIPSGSSGWVALDVTASLRAAKAAGYTWATFYMSSFSGSSGIKITLQAAESADATRRPYIATVVRPTMSVRAANGLVVADNAVPAWDKGTFFGTVEIGATLTNTFAVTNSGLAPLTISAATLDGPQAAQFQVDGMPATVDAGGVGAFTIAFTAPGVGGYSATLSIANDSALTPYRINVYGAGPLQPPVANAATDITGTAFFANWDESAGATNYFLDVATNDAFGAGDYVAGYSNAAVGNVTTHPVTGLLGHRAYYYRVRAQGTTGTSLDSNVIDLYEPENIPVANPDSLTILEDSEPTIVNVLANDTDADADALILYTVIPGVGDAVINPGNTNTTYYVPETDWNGTDTYFYVVVDGEAGGFDLGEVTVVVTPVNDRPSFAAGLSQVVDEDCGAQTVAGWATAISAGAANESAQVLTFAVSNDNSGLFSSQPSVAVDGTLTYTPVNDASGEATVSVTLTDDATAGGAALTTAVQTFTITVNPVNDMPSFTKGANQTVNEDCGPQTVPGWATAIGAGAANESGQELSFLVTSSEPDMFSSGPAVAADGTLTYTPANDANGVATVSVRLMDDASAGGEALTTAVQTFTITVKPVNDNPVAVADEVTVTEDTTAVVIDVLENDIDVDDNALLIYSVTQGAGGVVTINPGNTSLTYAPEGDWNGTSTFYYVEVDGAGGVTTGEVTVIVEPVNDMPSFTKGADEVVDEDCGPQTVADWATGISAGPANESAQVLTFAVSNNANALFSAQPAVAADGTLTYTPEANANGMATVSVALTDDDTAGGGALTTEAQTFTITVNSLTNDYTLDVKAVNGTVIRDAEEKLLGGLPVYDAGTVVELTALPDDSYLFSEWSGDASGSDNPLALTMDADKVVTAVFVPAPPTALPPRTIAKKSFTARWRWVEGGAPEGELSVARDTNFTDLVAGFESLYLCNDTEISVTGLKANRDYWYRVRRLTDWSGESVWSKAVKVRTGDGLPVFPALLCEAPVGKGSWQEFSLASLASGTGVLTVTSSDTNSVNVLLTDESLFLHYRWKVKNATAVITLKAKHPETGYKATYEAVLSQAPGLVAVIEESALTNAGKRVAQEVTLENQTGRLLFGVRLKVSGLDNPAWMVNRSGFTPFTGEPIREIPCVWPAGARLVVRVVFHSDYLTQAGPAEYSANAILPPLNGVEPQSSDLTITRSAAYEDDGLWLLGLPVIGNRLYTVSQSDDAGANWIPSAPPIRATANYLMWLDVEAMGERLYMVQDAGQ